MFGEMKFRVVSLFKMAHNVGAVQARSEADLKPKVDYLSIAAH